MAAVFAARRASMFSPHGMGERTHELGVEKEHGRRHDGGPRVLGGVADPNHGRGGEDEYDDVVEESNVDIGDVIAYAKLKKYDRSVRRRNLVHLFLAVLSAACFMLEIWLAYDEGACWNDFTATDGNTIDDRVKPWCMRQNTNTVILKGIISLTTFALIVMILDYYRFQLKSERNAYWFLTDSIIWRKHHWLFATLEILIILPHPFPTGYESLYDDKLGSLMFLRFYLFVRVLRDHSPIYRKRKQLLNDSFLKKSGAVEFNWLLCVKFLFLRHMWAFVVWGVIITWFTMAYVIWIFEREHNQSFTLDISVWMTCITMSTVGYGDVSPTNNSAKVAAGFTAVFGIILAALLVFAVMDALTLSPQDTRVRNLWTKKLTFDKQKVAASKLSVLEKGSEVCFFFFLFILFLYCVKKKKTATLTHTHTHTHAHTRTHTHI
jgi:hypothetical protein